LASAVVEQCRAVVMRHEATAVEEYVDDGAFRALVGEMLDTKAWAKEKKELWMRDASQYICFLQGDSLRECHRLWQSFLRQRIVAAAAGSGDRASASLELLLSRGVVKRGVRGEVNADGEDVMVQAGGDGWAAEDIAAAAAAGADVGASDSGGCNCVWNAARYGHAESLAALLAAGGDVNKCHNDGRSAIYVASRRGNTACLTQLISCGGDVNKCNNDGISPIFVAAQEGHADCLSQLISCGGDVNKCNNDGISLIYVAAEEGHADCLSQLISCGGDPRSSWNGTSALEIARSEGHAECVRVLEAALQ
jgi:hypothetical protein